MRQDKLDKLLKQWAAARATGEEHAKKLADRIVDHLAAGGPRVLDPAKDGRVPMPHRRKLAYAALGTAAVLLIAVALSFWSRWRSVPGGTVSQGDDALPTAAFFSQPELAAAERLFHEMETLFADDLRWVADADKEVRLGIGPVSGGPAAGATPLAVRVLVVQRNKGEAAWRKVAETDVLTRSQELVETVSGPKLDNRLSLWTYVVPDGRVAVDLSIRLTAPIRASVDVTNVLAPGKPAKVFSLQTEDAEYRIFQVVTPLPNHAGVSC